MQNNDEPALIAASLAGNTDTYVQLVDRYKNAVYRHCFAMVRDEDTAEDINQETFIAAYRALHSYDPTRKFSTWLFAVAHNKTLTHLARQKRFTPLDDATAARLASPHPTPEQQSRYTELHEAVNNLSPQYRAVISLYYWQGLSVADIASVLGSPEGSVKVWLRRAKQQLRKELA